MAPIVEHGPVVPLSDLRYVVFDWNGTIMGDATLVCKGTNEVILAYGGHPVTLQEFQALAHFPLIDFWVSRGCDRAALERDGDRVHRIWGDYYTANSHKHHTRPGGKRLLDFLQKSNIPCGIVSNHTEEETLGLMARLHIREYFTDIVARSSLQDATHATLSKHEMLASLLAKLPYAPNEIVVIGDTTGDIEAARACGCTAIALTGGYHSDTRLHRAGPDYLCRQLSEVRYTLARLRDHDPAILTRSLRYPGSTPLPELYVRKRKTQKAYLRHLREGGAMK